MEKAWDEWARHYEETGIESRRICQDGIVDEGEFRATKPRVLFIMKEVNEYPRGDIRTLLREKPWKAIVRWAAGILHGFPPFEELENLMVSQAYRQKQVNKIALINLKKTSGKSSSDMSVINAYAHSDRTLLLKQIENIDPSLIVAAGTMDVLVWLLDLAVKPDEPLAAPCKDTKRNIWIVPSRHPSVDRKPKETYAFLRAKVTRIREQNPEIFCQS
jgi:hypothetical protein